MAKRRVGLCTDLDRTQFPEFRETVLSWEQRPAETAPRSYPGFPIQKLPRALPRVWPPLDRCLLQRRSVRTLDERPPSRQTLGRLLSVSHGYLGKQNSGTVPSAGALHALELFVVFFRNGWTEAGAYHFDRVRHALARLPAPAARERWSEAIPSLQQVQGGALLWIVAGDYARVEAKYGKRAERFLILEAGHLMQNLCLASASLRCSTVPLGGFFETEIAQLLDLPDSDRVLYLGICGKPAKASCE